MYVRVFVLFTRPCGRLSEFCAFEVNLEVVLMPMWAHRFIVIRLGTDVGSPVCIIKIRLNCVKIRLNTSYRVFDKIGCEYQNRVCQNHESQNWVNDSS